MRVMSLALIGAVSGYSMQGLRLGTGGSIMKMRRAALSKVTCPRMDISFDEAGEFGTTDYTLTFKKDGSTISPWHDVPLEAGPGLYNMLTEIPKMTLKKMEVATSVAGNPIMQDEKKGKARLYHGPIFWNYGCLADVGGPQRQGRRRCWRRFR